MPGHRMPKPQPRRVQKVSPRRERDQPPSAPATVRVVAGDRMADRREVHANLMRSPGVQVRAQEISGVEPGET